MYRYLISAVVRKNHSTEDAVTYFTNCIRKGIDEGCVTKSIRQCKSPQTSLKKFAGVWHLKL